MINKTLVGLSDTLDIGRQYYNEAVATFYNTSQESVPDINGLLKSVYNPIGKSRLCAIINGQWVTFAYEGAVPTDIFYYNESTNTLVMTKPLTGTNSTFNNVTSGNGKFSNIESSTGTITTLNVDVLNVVKRINQTQTTQLLIEDNTIKLNSNLTGDPDEAAYLYAGIIVNRGNSQAASIKWDELKNRWILEVPADVVNAEQQELKTLELFGITDDVDRKIDINNSSGFYFDSESSSKNPGTYIYHDTYTSGIYFNDNTGKYEVRDKDGTLELIGLDLDGVGRKLKLDNSQGIEVYNKTGEPTVLDLIQLDEAGNEIGRGSLTYSVDDTLSVSTREKTFELKDIDEYIPLLDYWCYSTELEKGSKVINLPTANTLYITNVTNDTSDDNKNKKLLIVYVNGIHIAPFDYSITGTNTIELNEAVTEKSTITVYYMTSTSENYRMPQKTLPNVITGVEGNEIYGTNSSGAITGEFQVLVFKNSMVLAEGTDYTCDRITETRYKITFVESLIPTDKIIVYPFLSPNIFVKGSNALVFDTNLHNPDNLLTESASIIFRRGSLPAAGLRWNEGTNNLEIDNGTGIWEEITGSSSKFAKKRFVIESSTNTLDLTDFLNRNNLIPNSDLSVTVFKNGFLMDDPEDYVIDNYELEFSENLNENDVIWVFVGKSFIKSSNYLVSKKFLKIIETATSVLEFDEGFIYEPGTDTLSIYVNGILTQKDIDYIELNEHSVMFNYPLEEGTVVQAYTPSYVNNVQYTKKVLEFSINNETGDYLNSENSNCFITVNRGSSNPAYIKWDEVNDDWYLSNGDGKSSRILTSSSNAGKRFTQLYEYDGSGSTTLDIGNMIGNPDFIMVFNNGALVNSINYTYYPEEKKIEFGYVVPTSNKLAVIAFTSSEIQSLTKWKNTYTQRYSIQLSNSDRFEFSLDKTVNAEPLVSVFINGLLVDEDEYNVEYTPDKRTCKIRFSESKSGKCSVIININNDDSSLTTGLENSLVFENNQDYYEDDSKFGNWYIRSNRGKDLPPAYIKWDELNNEFKFNPGTNTEYSFAKVVYGNDFITPGEDEELLFVNKSNNTLHAFYNNEWHELLGTSQGTPSETKVFQYAVIEKIGWTLEDTQSEYKYYYDLIDSDIKESDIVGVFVDRADYSEAEECRLDKNVDTFDGKIRFWAIKEPENPINISYYTI